MENEESVDPALMALQIPESEAKKINRRGRRKSNDLADDDIEGKKDDKKSNDQPKKLTDRARKAKIDRYAKEIQEQANDYILEQFISMGISPLDIYKDGKPPLSEIPSPYTPFGQKLAMKPALAKAIARARLEFEEGDLASAVEKTVPKPVKFLAKFGELIVLSIMQLKTLSKAARDIQLKKKEMMKEEGVSDERQNNQV